MFLLKNVQFGYRFSSFFDVYFSILPPAALSFAFLIPFAAFRFLNVQFRINRVAHSCIPSLLAPDELDALSFLAFHENVVCFCVYVYDST